MTRLKLPVLQRAWALGLLLHGLAHCSISLGSPLRPSRTPCIGARGFFQPQADWGGKSSHNVFQRKTSSLDLLIINKGEKKSNLQSHVGGCLVLCTWCEWTPWTDSTFSIRICKHLVWHGKGSRHENSLLSSRWTLQVVSPPATFTCCSISNHLADCLQPFFTLQEDIAGEVLKVQAQVIGGE
jgi:hypothetical protein